MFLARYLSRGGIASRQQAVRIVEEGRVCVEGKVERDPHFLVDGHSITVDGGSPLTLAPSRIFAYHKPVREVVSRAPKSLQVSCFQEIEARYPTLPLLHSVGRLDYMSEGLLLFTNAGELSNCLEHPFNAFERQYHVELARDYRALPSLLNALGKETEADGVMYRAVQAKDIGNRWVHVKLTEGKNREIRKLFAVLGLEIVRLKRVAYGPFTLGELIPHELKEEVIPEEVHRQMATFDEWNESRLKS